MHTGRQDVSLRKSDMGIKEDFHISTVLEVLTFALDMKP